MQEYEDLNRWYSLEDYPNEIWKDIKGYEDSYQISTYGRIKSKIRDFYCGTNYRVHKTIEEHILHVCFRKGKYVSVTLKKQGQRFHAEVHRLVGEAFIPNIENKEQINHKDGDKHNNKVENLEWFTRSENALHSYYQLNNIKYKRNFTKKEREEIKEKYKQGISQRQLATEFNCSPICIRRLLSGESYSYID